MLLFSFYTLAIWICFCGHSELDHLLVQPRDFCRQAISNFFFPGYITWGKPHSTSSRFEDGTHGRPWNF